MLSSPLGIRATAGGDLLDTIGSVDAQAPFVVENHDEAYHVWRRAGAARRILVHIDAHHDMAWLDDAGQLTIGNYISQAIKDGIVREVVWVVPDASWDTRRSRSAIRRHLKTLIRQYAGGAASIESRPRQMSAQLRGIPVTVCALDALRQFTEPVLLDIDTDFFALRLVEYAGDDRPGELPWMWPEELAATLRQKHLRADIVTIAYSVAGGYAPIKWKYLGDALALEWRSPSDAAGSAQTGFRYLRQAATAMRAGDRSAALGALELAALRLPHSAAPLYHLALLHLDSKNSEAQRLFNCAVQIDPAYGGPHSSRGFVCLSEDRDAEAKEEFDRVLALDPGNPFARLGLARIAFRRRRWAEAETSLRQAIATAPRLVDGYRYLGDTLVKLGRDTEAGDAYSRSLKLALEGEEPIDVEILTTALGNAPRDRRHGQVHAALAQIDARAGRLRSANSGYRIAIAAGLDRAGVRRRLASVCFRQGQWTIAVAEGTKALALMPRWLRHTTRQAIRRIRRRVLRG